MFMTEDAIVEGTGAGQPLGILNSPALISVAKETGQAAATIVKENVDKMWSRMWARARKNAIWLINQDIEPQLLA
jgi:HK97 family phage major capsid protein